MTRPQESPLKLALIAGVGMFQTPCYINLTSQFPSERQAFITALVRMIQNLSIALESAGVALLISLQTLTQNSGAIIPEKWIATSLITVMWIS